MPARRALACALLTLSAAACGHSIPQPPSTAQPREGWQKVPYPAPPVLVQEVGPRPKPDAVWVDGSWSWERDDWSWKAGGWVRPLPAERYAKPAYARLADGSLLYVPGRWVINGKAKATPGAPASAEPSSPCPCNASLSAPSN